MHFLYWKACPKCSEAVGINYYPWNYSIHYKDDIDRELDIAMEKHQCKAGES